MKTKGQKARHTSDQKTTAGLVGLSSVRAMLGRSLADVNSSKPHDLLSHACKEGSGQWKQRTKPAKIPTFQNGETRGTRAPHRARSNLSHPPLRGEWPATHSRSSGLT
jgi:hypothetical protein